MASALTLPPAISETAARFGMDPQFGRDTQFRMEAGALDDRIVYLPIRHHSPACAFHVDAMVRKLRPAAVLIEGPRDADHCLEWLADPSCRMPLAIYTTYVDKRGDGPPHHHGAYYPLCDYSPELAALQAGLEIGSKVRFIDLTFAEKIASGFDHGGAALTRSLQSERHLLHSRWLSAVCLRVGARDKDELWDRLYESNFRSLSSESFFSDVWAYCAIARESFDAELLEADTLPRESCMRREIAREDGRVVVVTGGFHSVALRSFRDEEIDLPRSCGDSSVSLMRYSFDQLDALNGYASGMPSPEFYQRVWEGGDMTELLVSISRELRKARGGPSTADTIQALRQLEALASFRGHAHPTREDVLDAMRSVFVKGSMDVEGAAIMARAKSCMSGTRRGKLPDGVGRPPLLIDAEARADELGIAFHSRRSKDLVLQMYRSSRHREISRFLFRLEILEVPFASRTAGPDFVQGKDVERVRELWTYRWTPKVESSLIEASRFGASLSEAAAAVLEERLVAAHADAKPALAAVRVIVEACRAGLHQHLARLCNEAARILSRDAHFESACDAAALLLLSQSSYEPLAAHDLASIKSLLHDAWKRASFLLPTIASTSEETEGAMLEAMMAWHETAESIGYGSEHPLRCEPLLRLATDAVNPTVAGAVLGMRFGDGAVSGEEVGREVAGHWSVSRDISDGPRFLRGLFRSARSVCWRVDAIIEALHSRLEASPEEEFLSMLPHLRLAFSNLTPDECDRTARRVRGLGRQAEDSPGAVSDDERNLGARAESLLLSMNRRDEAGGSGP